MSTPRPTPKDRIKWTPEHRAAFEERERIMREQGFYMGQAVYVTVDASAGIPEHLRFYAGARGIVMVNLMHGPERISVKFPEATGSQIPHALDPAVLRPAAHVGGIAKTTHGRMATCTCGWTGPERCSGDMLTRAGEDVETHLKESPTGPVKESA